MCFCTAALVRFGKSMKPEVPVEQPSMGQKVSSATPSDGSKESPVEFTGFVIDPANLDLSESCLWLGRNLIHIVLA